MDNETRQSTIAALLDTMIPGTADGWPSAAKLQLGGRFVEEVTLERSDAALDQLIGLLPEDFATRDATAREAELQAQPEPLVQTIAAAAYRAYYTTPVVAKRVLELSRPI